MSTAADQPATKSDIEDLKDLFRITFGRFDQFDERLNTLEARIEYVYEDLGSVMRDGFQMVHDKFTEVDDRLDNLEFGQERIIRKLDANIKRTDQHSDDFKTLFN